MKLHPYYKEKLKRFFGIRSPSQETAKIGNIMSLYFSVGLQLGKLNEIKRAAAPYKLTMRIPAPEYKPLNEVLKAYKQTQYYFFNDYYY